MGQFKHRQIQKYGLNSFLHGAVTSMSNDARLRFRFKRGDIEVELEGDHDYVKEKFEELMKTSPATAEKTAEIFDTTSKLTIQTSLDDSAGLFETTSDGKLHFTFPFDRITAKEAIALLLYKFQPNFLGDKDLSEKLNACWKATKPHVIRARASELRREGKLISEKGRYGLSGAGLQWIRSEIIPRLKEGRP